MSTKTQPNSAVTAYLDAVRLYLSDLPDWDVEDLMADIEQHVIEVATEWDGPITSVLGDPVTFVDEYRQSADVPPVSKGPSTPPLIDRLVRSVENARKGHLWMSIRAFAKEARPGWWALRGYMAASVFLFIFSSTSRTTMVNPFVFGPPGLLVSAVGVVLSVHLGRRSQRPSWRSWVAIVLNVVVVVAVVISGQQVNDASYHQAYADPAFEVVAVQADSAYAVASLAQPVSEVTDLGLVSDLELAVGAFQTCASERGGTIRTRFVPSVGVEFIGEVDGLTAVDVMEECLELTNLRAAEQAYLDSIGLAGAED